LIIDLIIDLTPDLTPDLILDLIPDLTLDLIKDLTLDLIPDLIPDLTIDLIPDLTPDLIPDLTLNSISKFIHLKNTFGIFLPSGFGNGIALSSVIYQLLAINIQPHSGQTLNDSSSRSKAVMPNAEFFQCMYSQEMQTS
jgi:hypothetical protein